MTDDIALDQKLNGSPRRAAPIAGRPDDTEIASRLREWVHERYGKWITHSTAQRAVRKLLSPKVSP